MNKISKLLANKTLQVALNVIIAAFFIRYLIKLDISLDELWHANRLYLFITIILAIPTRYLFSYVWLYTLRRMGAHDIDQPKLHYIYAKSSMGRYAPGKVAWLIGKIVYGKSLGLSSQKLAVSSTLEIVAQLVSASYVGVILMIIGASQFELNSLRLHPSVVLPLVALSAVVFVFVLPTASNILFDIYTKATRKHITERFDRSTVLGVVVAYCLVWLLSSVPFYTLFMALNPGESWAVGLYAVGSVTVSGVIGMIAIFAPGGIGVREGSLILLLSEVISPEKAAVYSIMIRFLVIFMDVSIWAVTALHLAIRSKRKEQR